MWVCPKGESRLAYRSRERFNISDIEKSLLIRFTMVRLQISTVSTVVKYRGNVVSLVLQIEQWGDRLSEASLDELS